MKMVILAFLIVFALSAAVVWAGSPGTLGPTGYTLEDIYDYLHSGTAATEGGHSLKPPAGAVPGDGRFRSTKDIYTSVKAKFDECNAAVGDVRKGVKFFSTAPESWGVKTGELVPGFQYSPLLKTGQTTSSRYGDDGTYSTRVGMAFNYSWDVGTDTVKDNVTGLVWASNCAGAGCKNGSLIYWSSAIDWAEALSFAGYTDWRLPNIRELSSIVNYALDGTTGHVVDRTFFPNRCSDQTFWASTTFAADTNSAWNINFFRGGHAEGNMWGKNATYSVRAVRGGE